MTAHLLDFPSSSLAFPKLSSLFFPFEDVLIKRLVFGKLIGYGYLYLFVRSIQHISIKRNIPQRHSQHIMPPSRLRNWLHGRERDPHHADASVREVDNAADRRAQQILSQRAIASFRTQGVTHVAVSDESLQIWHERMERLDQWRLRMLHSARSQEEQTMLELAMLDITDIVGAMKDDIVGKIEGPFMLHWVEWPRPPA